MDEQPISVEDFTPWGYEVYMLKRAKKRFSENVIGDTIAGFVGFCAGGATEWIVTGTIDLATAGSAVAMSVVGLVTQFLICLFNEPSRDRNALALVVRAIQPNIGFAEILRQRKIDISDIKPLNEGIDAVKRAMGQLYAEQENVIRILRRANNPWTHKPKGWAELDDPLREWAGLAAVMHYRYGDGEILPVGKLYDRIQQQADGSSARVIHPMNFEMARKHAIECVRLVVREIQYPDYPYNPEPDDAFVKGTRLELPGLHP